MIFMIDMFSDPYDSLKTVKYLTFMNWAFFMGLIAFRISIISKWVQTLKCPSPRVAAAMHREGVEMEMRGRMTIPGSFLRPKLSLFHFSENIKDSNCNSYYQRAEWLFQHRGKFLHLKILFPHR